ncbi:MAG TPA: MFS transporter [Lachnospiraceae bacterium]|nr:MFS transporter [Lachnospiraceae bacterium]
MKFNDRHTLYACYIGYITQAIINNLSPLLFLTFHKQFGISLAAISILISINFCTQIAVDLISVKFVDKIGYRASGILSFVISAIGLVSLGLLPNVMPNAYVGLIIATMLNAIGGGLLEVLVSPVVEAIPLPQKQKASAMSLLHSFYCWGHVGVVILSTLYFSTAGIQNWMYLPMIWALVPLFDVFLFAKIPLYKLVEEEERVPLRKTLKTGIFWLLFLLMICAGASEQAMSQWSSIFAELGLGVSKTVGDLLGPCAFAICMGLSRLIYGKMGQRINLKKFIIGSSLLCVVSYLIAVFSPFPLLALIGCAMCGFSVGIMWPGIFSIAGERCRSGGTAVFALFAVAGDIGCASGPALVGVISNATGGDNGLKTGLLCAIMFPIVMCIGVSVLRSRTKKKSEA